MLVQDEYGICVKFDMVGGLVLFEGRFQFIIMIFINVISLRWGEDFNDARSIH